jgi:protein-S-isoprenylcysteine O-methyltransferase Ste14
MQRRRLADFGQDSARIRAEEKLLRTQFGGGYDVYCSRTSRLIPGLY